MPYTGKGSILCPSPMSSPCRDIAVVFRGKIAPSTPCRQDKKNGFESPLVIGRGAARSGPARKMRLYFRPLRLVQANSRHNHPPVQRIFNLFLNLLKPSLLYTLTMQLSRGQFANLFKPHFLKDGTRAGFEGINNPIAKVSNTLAEKISRSTLAKTSVGEAMGLRTITGRAIISGTVIGIVTFGPDVVLALRGRISKQQLFKNTTVGATALVGASIGQVLLPIPGLGAIAGAGVSGWIAKKTLDRFVEDDNVLMFQVFKEEFLDCAMQSRLSKSEFDTLITRTLCNNRMKDILTNMYASGEPRKYARALMNDAVSALFGEYKKIEEIEIVQGIEELSEETVAA